MPSTRIGSMSFHTRPLVPRDAAKAYAGLRLLLDGKLEDVGTVDMDAVHRCPACRGEGELEVGTRRDSFGQWDTEIVQCGDCDGTGRRQQA